MKEKLKKVMVLVLVGIMTMMLAACSTKKDDPSTEKDADPTAAAVADSTTTEEETTTGDTVEADTETEVSYQYNKSGEQLTIGFTALNMNNPFYVTMLEAMKELGAKENVVFIENDGQMDPTKQASGMEDFISKGVDGVILVPVDSQAVVHYVELCNDEKIPVVAVDSNVAGGDIVSFVTSNNYMGGELVGKYMAERLGGKGKICIIDYPLLEGCVKRVEGLMSVLNQYPDIEIIGQQKGGDMTDGQRLGETWLQQFDKIDAIFGINDPNALGALTAAEASGRAEELFVVGIDGSAEGIAAMKEGRNIGATAAQDPAKMGEEALIAMIKHINGETVESEIQIDTPLITVDDAK